MGYRLPKQQFNLVPHKTAPTLFQRQLQDHAIFIAYLNTFPFIILSLPFSLLPCPSSFLTWLEGNLLGGTLPQLFAFWKGGGSVTKRQCFGEGGSHRKFWPQRWNVLKSTFPMWQIASCVSDNGPTLLVFIFVFAKRVLKYLRILWRGRASFSSQKSHKWAFGPAVKMLCSTSECLSSTAASL